MVNGGIYQVATYGVQSTDRCIMLTKNFAQLDLQSLQLDRRHGRQNDACSAVYSMIERQHYFHLKSREVPKSRRESTVCPISSVVKTMDAQYLKDNVGDVLVQGLAQLIASSPRDPIEFLGNFLVQNGAHHTLTQTVPADNNETSSEDVDHDKSNKTSD